MVIRNKGSGKRLQRYYGSVNTQMGKTLEKLSSGYRINRAGDDAAGLAVSEKMRLQITGLGRAKENSREGTKLIQTGEGALQEIQSMLDRAEYLAGESANGTYMDELDRENLQKELDHLCSEIDRIAESANFNGIELFQNRGVEYESSAIDPRLVKFRQELEKAQSDWEKALEKKRLDALPKPSIVDPERWPDVSTALSGGKMTVEELKRNTKPGEFNIVYIEHDFETTPTPTDSDKEGTYTTGVGTSLDLTVDKTGGKKLSEILETEIVPNIVQNLLDNYPAFSYLTGSSIGIGLRLYDESSNTLASVKGGVSTANLQTYMLSVNINSLKAGGTVSEEDRVKLESTIAHEMMHAFMDEATTNGMFGYTGSSFDSSAAFPEWFIEGMAQTASGPGNWVKASSGLGINKDTSEDDIIAAIKRTNNQLKTDTGTSRYGTGYLACMYLGAAISAYQADGNLSNVDKADSASISKGLKLLLSNVIQGKSLDKAISELTGGSFSSTKDFQDKFDAGSAAGMAPFIKQLLTQTGDGLGGLATGDLTHKDLADDKPLTIKLFQLDTTAPIVSNKYPDGHKVLTGGTTSTDGTAPVELTVPKEYGDFMVEGPDLSGVSFNAVTGTLTVSGDNIRISMKTTGASTTQNIVLNSGGTVRLDGVSTSGTLDINSTNTKIKTTGKNAVGNVNLAAGVNVTFDGSGQLKISGAFSTADNKSTVNCNGGALIVGSGGSGRMGDAKVTVNGASVAATLTDGAGSRVDSAGKAECEVNRTALTKLPENITSITVGGTKTDMLLSSSDPTCLWLDKKEGPAGTFGTQKVTFSGTNAAGEAVSQAYLVQWDDAKKEFVFDPFNVFTVTGGTEGTDYYFDAGTNTLKILTNKPLTISGGTKEIDGKKEYGTIEIADGVKSTITLDGVQIDATKIGGNTAGILLGNGSDIKLTMKGENTIIGSGQSAGIQFFGDYKKDSTSVALEDSSLHIDMTSGSTLTATGGTSGSTGGAGIGTAWATDSSKSSIVISGTGKITATGGNGAAGIGGSEGGDMGDITIDGNGLTIKTVGGNHGAGIGAGGWVSTYSNPVDQGVGNITITGKVDIDASSKSHGTGIGSACHSGVGDITIGKPPAGPGNDGIKIYANGGNDGAAIGSGWSGTMGTLTIWGGTIDAEAGSQGAGIGSGWQADGGDIIIKGGTITATGKTSSKIHI
ncbi:MAG: hypothetical protein K2O18_18825 [Oscillospiraceae bacterium]|nr:hypothetical protein [Oscillospiraceae bacterium]